MRQRIPLVLSLTALVVAVFGFLQLGLATGQPIKSPGAGPRASAAAAADCSATPYAGIGLPGCNLQGASLVAVDLVDANAQLADSDLADADLTNANLRGADLKNADLAHVVWSDTTCPDGTNSDNGYHHSCLHDLTIPI
jgi:uncharacterized protein YjbI with pentapeptide repeats